MAKEFIATLLCLVSPWKLFFFMPRTTPRTCCKTIFPPQSKSSVPRVSHGLPGLNIGIMHRGVIRSSHRRIPRDWSPACDMAVKTLTDCFTNTRTQNAHTNMQRRACTHTAHTCTQNHIDRLFYQLHRLDWHLFSWVSSQLPALRGKYNLTVWHCKFCYLIKTRVFLQVALWVTAKSRQRVIPWILFAFFFLVSVVARERVTIYSFICHFILWQHPYHMKKQIFKHVSLPLKEHHSTLFQSSFMFLKWLKTDVQKCSSQVPCWILSAIPLAKSRAFEHVKNWITLLNHIDIWQLILLPYVTMENILVKCFLGQMLLWG